MNAPRMFTHGVEERRMLHVLLSGAFVFLAIGVGAQPYTQYTSGVVDIEAENYSSVIGPLSAHSWTPTTAVAGYSGPGAMEATPNSGSNIDANWTTTSPELRYTVNFNATGTHYVWLRGYGATPNDDSAHASLNGGAGTSAARITLSTNGAWQWTRTQLTTGNPTTVSVPSTGNHTLNVWMREDGFVVDRVLLTPNAAFSATPGNAWHIAGGAEPGITSMRAPFREIAPGTSVTIYSGNQFQGPGGNPGNQFQTGSSVFWRLAGAGSWTAAPMAFHSESGNNKYFSATIPGTSLVAGDVVEYYIRAIYDDHLPTYIHGTDRSSMATETETVAQGAPFSFTVQPPLSASGSFVSVSQGAFEGRVYQSDGHIALFGPDLSGAPLALSTTLAPPGAYAGGKMRYVGGVVSSTPSGGGLDLVQNLGAGTIQSRLSFAADGVLRYEVTDWGGATPAETMLRAASPADEHFYGFGEKFNNFDQAGRRVGMLNYDEPGPKGDRSYKVAPWFLSTRGYGLYLGSSAESVFDMRSTFADRYTIEVPEGALRVDLVGGPKLTEALTRYTGLTGRTPVPPEWVFGPWISTDVWRTGGEVRYAITKMVAQGVPCSVIVFDSPWSVSYNDYTWNMTQFGNGGTYESVFYPGFSTVTEMMSFLRSNGVKAVCWTTPFINTVGNDDGVGGQNLGQAPNYAVGAANNFFVRSSPGGPPLLANWWKGTGSPVDFTNPAATAWLQGQVQALIDQSVVATPSGPSFPVIGGFKTDDGEARGTTNVYIPPTASYFDGRTGVQMRNGYALEYHRAFWNILGNDGILFARSGYAGSQAFPAYWSGDNDPNFSAANGLPSVIIASQSSAMSGFSMWSSDVGGYLDGNYETNQADLFMRWSQFGIFTPIMQMHRQVGSNNQYPWSYGAAALANYRECANLHSRLFPYIYTYAHIAEDTGIPIMRPLVLMDQADPNIWGINHTYHFGNELLVAPIIAANATTRTVYLPAGTWHDYWTNAEHAGGQNLSWSNADATKYPLFVREGSIVPMLLHVPQSLCPAAYVDNVAITTKTDDLDVLVYPDAAFGFTMYDGTDFAGTSDATSTTIAITSAARPMQFRIHGTVPPHVGLGPATVPQAPDKPTYDAMSTAWWHDAAMSSTYVKFPHAGGTETLVLGPVPTRIDSSMEM